MGWLYWTDNPASDAPKSGLHPQTATQADVVPCDDCGVLVLRTFAKRVVQRQYYSSGSGGTRDLFYCPAHTPKYQIVRHGIDGVSVYWREMRVHKDGTPIGYAKVETAPATGNRQDVKP